MNKETLSDKLAKIINLDAVHTDACKFVRPFVKDGRPARFWEICCFVADRKIVSMSDINRHFYGSKRSDWHSVILYLCSAGLLSNKGGFVRPGLYFDKYRQTVISEING